MQRKWVSKFTPTVNELISIDQYTMLHILEGSGGIQVDFKNYFNWQDKLIFLEKGQCIKFLSDAFVVRKMEFDDHLLLESKEMRVLFKHLVSLGYIDFKECDECQKYLSATLLTEPKHIVDISSQQWYWQNPFKANSAEYQLIFDIKDVVDQQYRNHLSNTAMANLIGQNHGEAFALFTNKVGITVKGLMSNKRLTETMKALAFSELSVKEIAFDFGYKDPAYFSRFFKQKTGKTPAHFRKQVDNHTQDIFVQELFELLHDFHATKRNVDFYANKFHLSTKTFSKKVKEKLQVSVGQLIRQHLVQSAKRLLDTGLEINEVAFELGFEELSHFSSFFKKHCGITPTNYQNKKYK